ncbi:uncharacterized protein LOC143054574 [Mytilus galloprovincialis]|uniref:uncharacterized protein LOC143054574 n=1 Tax=Mytilus galloprovincialis TaxID=29158 RepID=UPI003F7BB6EE
MASWNYKLIVAAEKGRVEELKLCLANGANIDYQVGGYTALMEAASEGHVEVCQLLLENRCNKDITNDGGWTALMFAASGGHVEVSRLLLENRCNKDITNDTGYTALMLAAMYGHVEVSRLLLENKCNKDITMKYGKTALHLAAQFGELHVTRYLVEEGGISPFVKTHEGKTPYDLAAATEFGQKKEVMEYLQTVMSKKSSGVTAGLGKEDSIRSTMLNKLLGSGSYESFDMRCMVTGQFSVGKSSLVKLLVGDNVPEGRHATDGITLIEGRCGLDIETRNWIMIDKATYNALDVVYNKVLMTSIEEDESKQAKPVDSQHAHAEDNPSQKSQATKSTSWPVNDSSEPSTQPQTAQSLSQQTSSSESKKQQMKKKMTTKMTKKEIRKRMEKVLKSGKYKMKVGRLIFWDFGGQYVYYTTHQTFMTYRALFLVVFDGSKRLNEEVPDVLCFPGQHMTPTPAVFLLHWVNSILTYCKVVYAGIPRILFVATHKDKIPVEDVETRRALLYSEVEELFKDHEGRNHLVLDKKIFVNATDKNDQEIESLKKAITELTFDHPCWGERMPNAWVPLELEIAELVAAGKQILSLVELKELNSISKVSVLDSVQLHDFLHFQHSLGKLIYFNTIQLQNYVIINPLLMVEVMRSFVTDEGFWPKKRRIQETFRRMSESGIIHREDLYQIWKQKDFRAVLPYKEFIFNILIHLDILAEQRRYDTASGSRLPVEMFFVPCMVTQRNTTSFMDKECTPVRAICLAFVFKGTVIPPALPNRLISACLSMWTLKQYEGRKLLFSGFVVVSFDKSHDIVVCVEGNKILLYIVHKTSAGLIVRDIATVVKECLVTTLERISDFYQSTIHVKRCQQLPFHLEYSCSEMKCFIDEEEALQSNEWVCDTHNITHRAGNSTIWNQEKEKEQCEPNCPGLSDDALNQRPSDIELLRFSIKCASGHMHELVTFLEMSDQWDTITENYPTNKEVAKFVILLKWKEKKEKNNFRALAEALTNMEISSHVLCQVRRIRIAETDIPSEYLDCIPTDEILDALAPKIGQVFFQLGTEMGLATATLESIQYKYPRQLIEQNREVLFTWRDDRTVTPTIRILVQALANIGKGTLLQNVFENVDPNTLRGSENVTGIGAKPKKKSEQVPLSQQKMPKNCSIA